MGKSDSKRRRKGLYREMRVAYIREPAGAEYVVVVFLESARFYKLPKENPKFGEILGLLRDAMAQERMVRVRFASPDSDIIDEVSV